MNLFDELERNSTPKTRDTIVRCPLNYPGGKSRSVKYIVEHLPYRQKYVEPFGGSAAILLARHESPLEVYNDRYGGVVSFYRCMRSKEKMEALCDRLKFTIHSREEWVWCAETNQDVSDDIERAARWYYLLQYSFGGLCRNFGRSTNIPSAIAGKIRNNIELFSDLHNRFKKVQVENQDWSDCMHDYDDHETVFYIDPPYIDADAGIYEHKLSHGDHRRLLVTIFELKGFVAVSGYTNPLYESCPWTARYEWDSYISLQSHAYTDSNFKKNLKGLEERKDAKEVLWIKE